MTISLLIDAPGGADFQGYHLRDVASLHVGGRSLAAATLEVSGNVIIDGGLAISIVTKTANYTTTLDDHTILCGASGGAFTITLLAAADAIDQVLYIKKTDSSGNAITIDAAGSETIDGDLTVSLSSQYEALLLHCDGSNWHVL
jgi:hypothetical protein